MTYIRRYCGLNSIPVRASGNIRQSVERGQLGALGSLFTELFGGAAGAVLATTSSAELECLNRANASSQVAAIDAEIDKLTKTWTPTGYYAPADVQMIADTLATEAEAAGSALSFAPLSTSDAQMVKDQAFKDLLRKYKDREAGYRTAIATAKASGANVIDAPGLKDWVISSMRAISDAYVTATVLQCRQSWAEKWLDKAYKAMAAIGAVAARVLGVVKKLGDKVIDAVDTAAGITGAIIKYAPYAAVGLGGYLLYKMIKKRT